MQTQLTRDVHKRTYELKWGELELDPRKYPYSRTGRTYQPATARVRVTRISEGLWTLYDLELYGLAHKKDGTVGLQAVTERFYGMSNYEGPEELAEAVDGILRFLNNSLGDR